MKSNYINSIGDIYGNMLNGLKKELIKEGKDGKQPPNAFNSKLPIEKSKPIDGYNKPLNDSEGDCEEDEQNVINPPKNRNLKASDTLARKAKKISDPKKRKKMEDESFKLGVGVEGEEIEEKNHTESINTIMKQSAFNKLVSKVLKENLGQDDSDLDALGLDDSTPDSELDDEFGDDLEGDDDLGGEDTVTFTLDRTTAQALVDVLQGALGGDVEDDLGGEDDLDLDTEEDFGGEDDMGGEDEFNFDEDNEEWGTKPAPDKKGAFQVKNNKVGGKANPKGAGKASTDVTDDQGTKDGAPSFAHLQGKNNQVKGQVKVGDFFK